MQFDENSPEAAKKVTELMEKSLGEIAMEILDLEAQVNSLSDILAEKDHRIMDLEAMVRISGDILPKLDNENLILKSQLRYYGVEIEDSRIDMASVKNMLNSEKGVWFSHGNQTED